MRNHHDEKGSLGSAVSGAARLERDRTVGDWGFMGPDPVAVDRDQGTPSAQTEDNGRSHGERRASR